jgi:hypothetical protein
MVYIANKTVLLDIQFVTGNNNQQFVKELSYVYGDSTVPKQYMFRPPYHSDEFDQKTIDQNKFNELKVNGLNWDTGTFNYLYLREALQPLQDNTIIVKGIQKKKFLEMYLNRSEIIDLDIGCSLSHFKNYETSCVYHPRKYARCAINYVMKLLFFMEKNNLLN